MFATAWYRRQLIKGNINYYDEWNNLPIAYTNFDGFSNGVFQGRIYRYVDNGIKMIHNGVYNTMGVILDSIGDINAGYIDIEIEYRV